MAANYVDWRGVTPKNYLCGRETVPSELRHKVTILIELEMTDKLADHLALAFSLINTNVGMLSFAVGESVDWESKEFPHDVMPVVSFCNVKNKGALMDRLDAKAADKTAAQHLSVLKGFACSTYQNVTFVGKPDNGGKLPYVYVMGPDPGKEPLYHGELTQANLKDAIAAITKGRKQMAAWCAEGSGKQKWRWFYGNIPNPKYNTSLAKTLEKAKNPKLKKCPLEPVMKELLTSVKSTDEDKANEAQVLFDAIVQAREELKILIRFEAGAWPHRAHYDIQRLAKFWPSDTQKSLEKAKALMKQYPQAEQMGKHYVRLMQISEPSFIVKNKSEMKKLLAELEKMSKSMKDAKESQNIHIQNAALLLDMKIESTKLLVQSKVATP